MKILTLVVPVKPSSNTIELGDIFSHDTIIAFSKEGVIIGPVINDTANKYAITKGMTGSQVTQQHVCADYEEFFSLNTTLYNYSFKIIKS